MTEPSVPVSKLKELVLYMRLDAKYYRKQARLAHGDELRHGASVAANCFKHDARRLDELIAEAEKGGE